MNVAASRDGEVAADILDRARRIGEEVLFPSALETDRSDSVPLSHLDRLAAAGFYGLAGPAEAGGLGIDIATGCRVIEIFAGSCLATTFVWLQHHGAVFTVAVAAQPALRAEWLGPLCRGERRAGVAFAGVLPRPLLQARRTADGWVLDGVAPWITGWGRIDAVHVSARHGEDVVWALIDARESDSLAVERLRLVAVDPSATVTASFEGHVVPADRVTNIEPYEAWVARDPAALRINGSLALGVAGRCCGMVGPSALDDELAVCRTALDTGAPETMPAARAQASELAMRAASSLVVAAGARSILQGQHAQRLAREALFLLVFGSRPLIRSALLERMGAATA